MDDSLAWVFLILLGSLLIGWLGARVLKQAERIEIGGREEGEGANERSLLSWLHYAWQRLWSGNWRIARPGTRNQPGQVEKDQNNLPSPAIQDRSSPAAQWPLANQPVSNVQLILDIPLSEHTRITIDAGTDRAGQPALDMLTEQQSFDIPVRVEILPSSLTNELKVTSRQAYWGRSKIYLGRLPGIQAALSKLPLGTVLFVTAICVYLLTRLVGLDKFPIYFFTDEAVHTILAEDLVNNQFHYNGIFLPTFFPLGASFGLNSLSVYLQVLPYLFFGKSVFVTRMVSVLVSLLGAISIGLILRDYFKSPYWWSGVLLLSVTPVWFLHSRTAFEYVELTAFYALFLYFYLSYRLRSARWLYAAIISGALVFYTHGLGQFLMAATVFLLLLIDFRYHWKHKKTILLGLALIAILAIPYFRFTTLNPGIFEEQLRMRGSYWLDKDLTAVDKLFRFGKEYLRGINPLYWFLPNNPGDLARHQMKGYGYLLILELPFFVYGLWLSIRNIYSPANRIVLASLLAAPFGAALAQITILRVIWFVVPATLITALGMTGFLSRLEKRGTRSQFLQVSTAIILIAINLYMLRDGLRNGPLWFSDYSLYGMQYGAQQLFGEAIPEAMQENPAAKFVVTPTWANGTDNFVRFFMTPEQQSRLRLDSIEAYLFEKLPLDDNLWVVLTGPEYEQALASQKFKQVDPQRIIYYPDGTPGFYFVRLAYADNVDEIFAAEKLARSQPEEGVVNIAGQPTAIRYSRIDMGQPENIFDGDTFTLMRGLEANPYVIELAFSQPRSISQIQADFANMDFTMTASLYSDPNGEPVVYEVTQRGNTGDPHVDLIIDRGPGLVSRLHLEILSLNGGERPHIHVRELNLVP